MHSSTPAFALGAYSASSSFTSSLLVRPCASPVVAAPSSAPRAVPARRVAPLTMKDETTFMPPQPGDPGYKPPPPVPKGTGMVKSEKKPSKKEEPAASAEKPAAGKKDDKKTPGKKVTPTAASGGFASKLPVTKGGLNLLKDDLLKNAPSFAGVGRQDVSGIMKPMYGEPGYKPQAYETLPVSELGISPFPEDANAVGKVGGIDAVKKAAKEVKQGKKTADEVKKEVLKIKTTKEKTVYDIPDYLKPLPEDGRMTYTWKNYDGR